jgi:hypothetical protein
MSPDAGMEKKNSIRHRQSAVKSEGIGGNGHLAIRRKLSENNYLNIG